MAHVAREPGITVRDVWRGTLPPSTELLAGGGGLERRVEWATALRTRPPAFDAVRGGELAFVPVQSIRLLDERLDLPQVMRSLAEKGGVAVAVVGDTPAGALELADALRMPLLRLPDGTTVADVQQETVRFIVDQRTRLHDHEQQLRLELTELALSDAGVAAIVERLASVTGAAAVLEDAGGTVTHRVPATAPPPTFTEHTAGLLRWAATVAAVAADPPVREVALDSGGTVRLCAPIPLRDAVGGVLSVYGEESRLGHVARLAVSRAAAACAIDLDRQRAVRKAREDLEGGVLDTLLVGGYASEQALLHRAERLGLDLSGELTLLLARCDADPDADRLAAVMQTSLRRLAGDRALCGVRHGMAVAVLGGRPAAEVVRTVQREAAAALEAPVSLGAGRGHSGPDGARQSYREAEQALAMGTRLFGEGRATAFADLGLYRLLFALQGHGELDEYYRDHAGRLADYDARTGAGLLATLEAFFRCHGSPTETAQALGLHRNTVLYRLRRIQEVAGVNLDDPDVRLNLQLCLRVREVLTTSR